MTDGYENEKHPDRYRAGEYECQEVLKALVEKKRLPPFITWLYGAVFKYVWRLFEKDDPRREIAKIRNYLSRMEDELCCEE